MIKEKRIILGNHGKIDPLSLENYIKTGGYDGLKKALKIKPKELIQEITDSGLRGRGGAGFPTGLKWKFTADAEADRKYVICNADEGEPGTFKDKAIMEENPHINLEGIIIAAYAIGATKAFIYIRGEYYKSIEHTQTAIENAYKNNLLGQNILDSGFDLDVEIKLGAGSYLCGEELTLIESLEGKRGNPRIKPPFPAQKGVFGKPTLINNVETLSNIPGIIVKGKDWYRNLGTKESPGTKIFTISGCVKNPGIFEVELGTSLKDLIYVHAGGIRFNKQLKGILLGGAAGTFIDESLIDVKMDYDALAEKNCTLGSGAIIVLGEDQSIKNVLKSTINFFKHESCGKCVPCRVGCKQLSLMVNELDKANNKSKILDDMLKQAEFMARTSLCPLGQSPVLPIKSAVKYFKKELIKN